MLLPGSQWPQRICCRGRWGIILLDEVVSYLIYSGLVCCAARKAENILVGSSKVYENGCAHWAATNVVTEAISKDVSVKTCIIVWILVLSRYRLWESVRDIALLFRKICFEISPEISYAHNSSWQKMRKQRCYGLSPAGHVRQLKNICGASIHWPLKQIVTLLPLFCRTIFLHNNRIRVCLCCLA